VCVYVFLHMCVFGGVHHYGVCVVCMCGVCVWCVCGVCVCVVCVWCVYVCVYVCVGLAGCLCCREETEESTRECTITFSRQQKLVNDQLKIVKREQHMS